MAHCDTSLLLSSEVVAMLLFHVHVSEKLKIITATIGACYGINVFLFRDRCHFLD